MQVALPKTRSWREAKKPPGRERPLFQIRGGVTFIYRRRPAFYSCGSAEVRHDAGQTAARVPGWITEVRPSIMLSSLATMYQFGLFRQAAAVGFAAKIAPAV